MDSFEWNKIFGAFLGSLLTILVVKEIVSIIYHIEKPEELAAMREFIKVEPEPGQEVVAEPKKDFATLLAEANATAGQRLFAVCSACHNAEKGGSNGIGPNLWNVIGRDIAGVAGFNYSSALQGKEGAWTLEKMDAFILKPSEWAPGTNMAYMGLKDDQRRAHIIEYLRTQADNPVPKPEPTVAEDAPADDAPAPADEAGTAEGAPAADGEPAASEDDTAEAADDDTASQEDDGGQPQ